MQTADTSQQINARIELRLAANRIQLQIPVPVRPVRPIDLLPIFQGLADDFTKIAADDAQEKGQAVSCKKACGACCRQMVPMGAIEARHIAALANSLPEPRKSHVLDRFAEARAHLVRANLLDRVFSHDSLSKEQMLELVLAYFDAGIACPFLDDESCSIYSQRPIVCREYLVLSPAANCAKPAPETIRKLELPAKVWIAVARIERVMSSLWIPWVPLIIAPEWAEANPEDSLPRPGPDILRDFLTNFTRSEIPGFPFS